MSESSELPFFNFLPLQNLETDKTVQVNTYLKEIDDSLRWLFENSPAGGELILNSKNISIENFNIGDEFVFFRAAVDLTITKLSFVVQGTGPVSATAFVRFGPDRSAPATNVINAGTVVTSTTTGDEVIVFDNAVILAGDWIIVDLTADAGTTRNEFSLTMEYV